MKNEYNFSVGKKNPYTKRLKKQSSFRPSKETNTRAKGKHNKRPTQ